MNIGTFSAQYSIFFSVHEALICLMDSRPVLFPQSSSPVPAVTWIVRVTALCPDTLSEF